MEHWIGRAVQGELDGGLSEAEIMNNYQHSLTIRPCVCYCQYQSQSITLISETSSRKFRLPFD